MTAIGIDVGNTYSRVAVYQHGRVEVIANKIDERATPNWVSFIDNQILIGEAAKYKAVSNHEYTVHSIKRLIGRKLTDPSVIQDRKMWTFEVNGTDEKPTIEVKYMNQTRLFSPEEIFAMILTKMKEVAETYLGEPVRDAVVTVPAYFNDRQRQATKDAVRIAGLNLLRLINEPIAAAIAYGYDKHVTSDLNILVFDLGRSALDVSIVSVKNGVFDLKATSGNARLGGDDFDNRLVDHFVEQFRQMHGEDASNNRKAMYRLLIHCERVKKSLSHQLEDCLLVDCFFNGIDFFPTISRVCFEDLCGDLFKQTLIPVEEALRDANMRKDEINEIVLVGGSTRIPKIQNILRDFFNGKNLNQSINPDEAVVCGAAIQAARLNDAGRKTIRKIAILDVAPLSLGTDVHGDTIDILIKRNTPIPTKQIRTYSTSVDNQSELIIDVYENNLLGRFVLDGIKPAPRGEPKIEVTFDLDVNGILEVLAIEKGTGKRSNMIIDVDRGRLSKEEVDDMIANAERLRVKDMENKDRIKAKCSLEKFAYHVKRNLEDDDVQKRMTKRMWDTISTECDVVLSWLATNQNANKEEFLNEKKKLEELWALNQ